MDDNKIIFPNLGFELDNLPTEIPITDSFSIHYYGIIIAFGLMLAVFYGLRRCKQFGIKSDDLLDGVLWIVPFAIICARAYYVIFEWDQYAADPISALYIWKGGLAIYGGVIGAAIGIIVFTKVKKISTGAIFDLVGLGFLIGQSIGRWGNFFNREAFGCYSDGLFAMRIVHNFTTELRDATPAFVAQVDLLLEKAVEGGYSPYVQVHPTFFYESLWNAVGFVMLHFLSKKRRFDGQIALGYVAWYGLGRAIIEGLRMDSLEWGPFRVSQLLAAVSCIAAVAVLLIQWFRPQDPQKLFVNRIAAAEAVQPEDAAEAEETE